MQTLEVGGAKFTVYKFWIKEEKENQKIPKTRDCKINYFVLTTTLVSKKHSTNFLIMCIVNYIFF